MKFQLSCAIVLCVCLGQICFASNKFTEDKIKLVKEDLQNKVHGVSAQFVEDVTTILDHEPSNPYFVQILRDILLFALNDISQQHGTKFSVSDMGPLVNKTQPKPDYHKSLRTLDYYKLLQSSLSKQFSPEQYNGIINVFYIKLYPNATSDEIASVVNYLDGTDNAATKLSYLDSHNFPDPVASDCPDMSGMYADLNDKLKSMVGIKPKVFQDFASIQEKFPCNLHAIKLLKTLVSMIRDLHGDQSKINACMQLASNPDTTKDAFEYYSTLLEKILLLRLPEETYRGALRVISAFEVNTPQDEIEKALEYLYDEVPKADC